MTFRYYQIETEFIYKGRTTANSCFFLKMSDADKMVLEGKLRENPDYQFANLYKDMPKCFWQIVDQRITGFDESLVDRNFGGVDIGAFASIIGKPNKYWCKAKFPFVNGELVEVDTNKCCVYVCELLHKTLNIPVSMGIFALSEERAREKILAYLNGDCEQYTYSKTMHIVSESNVSIFEDRRDLVSDVNIPTISTYYNQLQDIKRYFAPLVEGKNFGFTSKKQIERFEFNNNVYLVCTSLIELCAYILKCNQESSFAAGTKYSIPESKNDKEYKCYNVVYPWRNPLINCVIKAATNQKAKKCAIQIIKELFNDVDLESLEITYNHFDEPFWVSGASWYWAYEESYYNEFLTYDPDKIRIDTIEGKKYYLQLKQILKVFYKQ